MDDAGAGAGAAPLLFQRLYYRTHLDHGSALCPPSAPYRALHKMEIEIEIEIEIYIITASIHDAGQIAACFFLKKKILFGGS